MKNKLVTVNPKIRTKGFKNDNLNILSSTKDDLQVNHRIVRLMGTNFYKDLSNNHKDIIMKIFDGYQRKISGMQLEKDQYVLSNHELVEFENTHDWEVFRYLVYRYKYNMYPE